MRSGLCSREMSSNNVEHIWNKLSHQDTYTNRLSHQDTSTNRWTTWEKTSVRAYKAWLQVVFSHSDLIANLSREFSKIGHVKNWCLRPVWEIGIIPILFELHIVKDAEEDLNKEYIARTIYVLEHVSCEFTWIVSLKDVSKGFEKINSPGKGLSTSEPQTGLHKS